MTFHRDILMIDIEATDADIYNAQAIQIGAVLLDRHTLEEKQSYLSYITATAPMNPEAQAVHGITVENLKNAPTPTEVTKKLIEMFGTDVMLASWVARLDIRMLQKLFLDAGHSTLPYDYHYLDVWPAAYVHLIKQNYEGSLHSEDMFQAFGLSARTTHDALDDCRRASEILRIIIH